jgi:predicted unusual protein kinase regulating ubiquinone biosynthesis (AarF/ABC1/UbiB family)
MLKARDVGTYKDLLMLFTRYGRKDFRLSLKPEDILAVPDESEGEIEPDVQRRAEAFANCLKDMGATYVKFGQVLSTRPDIVPPEYIAALESLQDQVEPFSFAEVETIVQEELGVRISKAFETFESTPVAAASLGQVHRAVLRDGREVVVKVQRPNVREQVRHDLEVFTDIATTLEEHSEVARKLNLVGALEQARLVLHHEVDYLQEAHNTELLRRNLAQFPQIYIPAVIHDMTTSRVLTSELVRGRKISKLTPLGVIEHDYADLASVLTEAYLKQICVDGFWHSDPHPGNVFIRDNPDDDEGRAQIVLLDFGMTGRISREFQDEIIKLLLAVASNRGAEVADACIRMSEVLEKFEATKFVHEISNIVANFHDLDVKRINVGQLLFSVIAVANTNDLKAPAELALLAKTMLHLDSVTKRLDPDFNPQTVMRRYGERLMTQKLTQKFDPRNFYPALLDLNQLILDMPHRAREIIDLIPAGRLTFGVKLLQAEEFLGGFHKIANRITVGVVIAALLIASALMMRTARGEKLAVIGFVAAGIAAVYLIISTFIQDKHDKERAKMKGR